MFTKRLVPVLLAAASIACGGAPAVTAETTPARGAGADQRDARTSASGEATSDGCVLSSIYFDYDSNGLDARARETLARDASCLRERPRDSVTLVGGADGRGTEEYNFALGDRRARTVQTYLTGAGVEAQRLRVHSVGEEWASGEDDESMARDRRVDPAAR